MTSNVPKTAVHVTIAALKDRNMVDEGGAYTIAEKKVDIGIAVFCGKVVNAKEAKVDNVDGLLITLDDTTGIFQFIDVIRQEKIETGNFIKIFGKIRKNREGKTIVIVNVIRKIEKDYSSVMSCFMLEAMYTMGQVMGLEKREIDERMTAYELDAKLYDLSQRSGRVLGVVMNDNTEEGANIIEDFKHLKLSQDKLREILNDLADNGHIYTTIDDNHFKTT